MWMWMNVDADADVVADGCAVWKGDGDTCATSTPGCVWMKIVSRCECGMRVCGCGCG